MIIITDFLTVPQGTDKLNYAHKADTNDCSHKDRAGLDFFLEERYAIRVNRRGVETQIFAD